MKKWAMFLPQLIPLFVFPYLVDSKSKERCHDVFSYKGSDFGIVGGKPCNIVNEYEIEFEDYEVHKQKLSTDE